MNLTISIAGQTVKLAAPARKYIRMWKAPAMSADEINAELWGMAALALCWRGPNRPADGARPHNAYRYGERVLDDLLSRGATDAELDEARAAAMLVMGDALTPDEPNPANVAEDADFSEPSDGSSATV